MKNNALQRCAQLIREARDIVALTGAGVSTNAGIPDFRGPRGLYASGRYDPEKIFDIQYFRHDPAPFYDFARNFIDLLEQARPTFTHKFLAHWNPSGN